MTGDQPPRGMLDAPMRRCRTCDRWSYMAAVTGRCSACIQETDNVLGYVVQHVDTASKARRFGIPTTDLEEALKELRWYSENGVTCFIGEIRMVTSEQAGASHNPSRPDTEAPS